MKVPWAKLYTNEDEINQVMAVMRSGWLSQGPKVKELEQRLSTFTGAKHTVAINNGTSALDIALKILGVEPGDEVIVPGSTYIATANAVLYQHAVPVFADIDPRTYNMDPVGFERKITKKTKGVIVIDYGGQAADYAQISAIAKKHGLFVIEDGAPGLGGSFEGKKLCSFGDIATTSFHIAKIFSTVEGGMLFTDNAEYAAQARIIRSQGEDPQRKYHFPRVGHNYRMSDLHAAVGVAQMSPQRMSDVLGWRKKCADNYSQKLRSLPTVTTPYVDPRCEHAWFLYPVLVDNRDRVRALLSEKGVETNVSWPMPIYQQAPFRKFNAAPCPVAEDFSKRVLCLPMFFGLTEAEQDYVVLSLAETIHQAGRLS